MADAPAGTMVSFTNKNQPPIPDSAEQTMTNTPRALPVVVELSDAPDPMAALEAFADRPGVLLLESTLRRADAGRYSFLSADPIRWYARDDCPYGSDPFAEVRRDLDCVTTESVEGLPPFQGGAAGLLSYELGGAFERLPRAERDEFRMPALAVGLYNWVLAWDHERNRAWLIAQGWSTEDLSGDAERAADTIRAIRRKLDEPPTVRTRLQFEPRIPPDQLARQHPMTQMPGLKSSFTRDGYLRAVQHVIDYVHAGDVFQANLSQRLLYPLSCEPVQLYGRLRRCNPAPFAAYFAHDDWAVVSASPERFVAVSRGDVETRPIKGTRRRRANPEADLSTRDELRASRKDLAENVMIVDLLRNDLSRVCAPGTVRVPRLCSVEMFETVQHLVSEVRGKLAPGRTAWDLLEAVFPGGSITGAPKVRAMEIIAELEPTARGPYCGSLFYVGSDGTLDSSILIRTFTVRSGWIQCSVGGGIVAQSDCVGEYDETWHKADGMLAALG